MGASESKGGETVWGCCETRAAKGVPRSDHISTRLCGVGMGLDSQLLAANRVRSLLPYRTEGIVFPEPNPLLNGLVRVAHYVPLGISLVYAWIVICQQKA